MATINGNNNGETLNGTAVADTITALGGDDTVNALAGNDTVFGGDGRDILRGGTEDDTLYGEADKDQLFGDAGNDTLIGGASQDRLAGGAGNDKFVFLDASDSTISLQDVILDFTQGQDLIDLTALLGTTDLAWGGTTATPNGVWYRQIAGNTIVYADLNGDAAADFRIQVNGLIALTRGDFLGVVPPGPVLGNDTGSVSEDSVLIANGNVLANDTGGGGLSVTAVRFGATAGALGVPLQGTYGSLTLLANGGYVYTLTNGAANVQALNGGQTVQDVFTYTAVYPGGSAEATLTISIAGADEGVAVINGTANGETLNGTPGADVIQALGGADTVNALGGGDTVYGGDGRDTLNGGEGDDRLFGEADKDTLRGDGGDDTLIGGAAQDRLFGGAGRDTFVYLDASDSTVAQQDVIQDFVRGEDRIDLGALLGPASLAWGGTTATANGVWYQQIAGNTVVYADVTGDAVADFRIQVNGLHALTTADFVSVGNSAPVADDETYSTRPGQLLSIAAPGFLDGDVDADGDSIVATTITNGVDHGTLTAFPDGSFTYTSDPGFSGIDSFEYRISDGFGGFDTGTVTIKVENTAPVADDETYNTRPGQLLSIAAPGFLDGDVDADGDSIVATTITNGVDHGTLTAFPDGSFTYTSDPGFSGIDSFEYRISDGFGGFDTGTVTIKVENTAPVADDETYNTRPGQLLSIAAPGFLDGDVDADGDSIVATTITNGVDHGTLTAFPDGSFTYTSDPGYSGIDSFEYRISDGFGGFDTGTVTINVENTAPVADDETYTTRPGQLLSIAAPGFLEGDSDPDGDTVQAVSITDDVDHGTLTAFADGSFIYTSDPGYVGTDSFEYTISDGFGGTDTGTVTINVENQAPVADDETYNTRPGQTLTIAAPGVLDGDTDPDGDALTLLEADITGLQGTLLLPQADGRFSFTPSPGFTGTTSFTYTVTDGFGGTDTATVTIDVQNQAPVADDETYNTRPGQTLTIAAPGVLDGDTDPDGDALTLLEADITGLQGTLLLPQADGRFSFTPSPGFTGTTSFTYTVTDGFGGTDTATVTIDVQNQAPVADDETYNTRPGQTLTIAAPGVLDGDTDPDGDALTLLEADITGLQGTLLLPQADGRFSFTPSPGFTGTTSFTYTVTDGFGGTDTATVTIDVQNQAPVADDETYNTRPGQTLTIAAPGVLDGDTDPDGDALTLLEADITGLQGTLLLPQADGRFSFTPSPGFTGTTSFTYTVTDGFGGTDTATVTIDVSEPVAFPAIALVGLAGATQTSTESWV